jgi:1,4-dihydroxy-2-naphthoate octaprenyltransferase
MATSKLTDPVTWITLGVIVGIFVGLIAFMGSTVLESESQALTNESILEMTGVNVSNEMQSGFNTSIFRNNISDPIGGAADNKNEFSLDFVFGRKNANELSTYLYAGTHIPEVVLNIFRLDYYDFQWFVTIINWFFNIMVFVSLVYLILRYK